MSNSATDPTNTSTAMGVDSTNASPAGKGKGKATEDVNMEEEDDDDEEDEEEGDDEEDDDEEAEESFEEIDPSAIISGGRRTRGVKIDYTSKEALAKAGLDANAADEDEDEDADMKV